MNIKLSSLKWCLPQKKEPLFEIPSLEIAKGNQVLIFGPSGKGKTTLLHLISGLLDPTEGYIFLEGENLKFLSEPQRARLRRQQIGFVFQKFNLLDHLTVFENLLLCLEAGDEGRTRAVQALSALGIESLRDVLTAHLSVGEQQRVAVARVLAMRPSLILADEPTSGLDRENADKVLNALTQGSQKPTLVLVSHDERLRDRFEIQYDFARWSR